MNLSPWKVVSLPRDVMFQFHSICQTSFACFYMSSSPYGRWRYFYKNLSSTLQCDLYLYQSTNWIFGIYFYTRTLSSTFWPLQLFMISSGFCVLDFIINHWCRCQITFTLFSCDMKKCDPNFQFSWSELDQVYFLQFWNEAVNMHDNHPCNTHTTNSSLFVFKMD